MPTKGSSAYLGFRKSDILANLTVLADKAKQSGITPGDAQVIWDEVKIAREHFDRLKLDIFKHNANAPFKDVVDISDFPSYETLIFDAVKDCKVHIAQLAAQGSQSNTTQAPAVGLPVERLKLEVFDGKISEWNSWYSLFSCAVENNATLSPTQKFLYLRKYVKVEPYSLVSAFEINDVNFFEALKVLKARYQSERRLGSYYVNKLLSFQKTSDLRTFLNVHRTACAALENLKSISSLSGFLLFSLSYANLSEKLQRDFDMSRQANTQVPTTDDLFDFLQFAATNQELKEDSCSAGAQRQRSPQNKNSKPPFIAHAEDKQKQKAPVKTCRMCNSTSHNKLYLCDDFKRSDPQKRLDLIKQWNYCRNCIASDSHKGSSCFSRYVCSICGSKHHSLLHIEKSATMEQTNTETPNVTLVGCMQPSNQVILGTISCEVQSASGNFMKIRCLVDNGAQISLVKSSLVKNLGFKPNACRSQINGIAATPVPGLGYVDLKLRSMKDKNVLLDVNTTIVSKLCNNLPTHNIDPFTRSKFSNFKLADDDFDKSLPIDIILGCDVYCTLLSTQQPCLVKDFDSGLMVQNTIFGYIIQGRISNRPTGQKNPTVLFVSSLEQNIEKFWALEEASLPTPVDPDVEQCEDFFKATVNRLPSGRYSVKLPFKDGISPKFLNNRNSALANYRFLEARLSKDSKLRQAYDEQILDYLKCGHMTLYKGVPSSFIMPQLLVVREEALTTRLRVVFNASCSAFNISTGEKEIFNNYLLPGAKLQADLPSILQRFRLNEVALTADIKAMFRMVEVDEADRQYQHILYRQNPNYPLEEYEIKVVLFGQRSSPYLCQRVILKLIEDDGHLYPEAANALKRSLYIDDYVDSVEDTAQARQLKDDISKLMLRGGFTMRKWASSHPSVLEDTSTDDMGKIDFNDEDKTVKILGLQYCPTADAFCIKIVDFEDSLISKRSCLSFLARTYDVLGLVAPVIFKLKVFLQKLWLEKVSWDEELPQRLVEDWRAIVSSMPSLRDLRIPRCIKLGKPQEIHLVGFSDASELGYAGCVYLVAHYSDRTATSNLLQAKTKLSPLKTVSIPRLELCGFLLLCQTIHKVIESLPDVPLASTTLFTDSEIVLAWVKTSPHKLKTFVANRVTRILELTSGMVFAHVASELNPADCASRSLLPHEIQSHPLWWAGPSFLLEPRTTWAQSREDLKLSEIPEQKKDPVVLNVVTPEEEKPFEVAFIESFSSLPKLQRIMGYMLRFIRNCRLPSNERLSGRILTVRELDSALNKCVYLSQQVDFPAELHCLRNNKPITGKLLKLSPFLQDELIKVGGRLTNSNLAPGAKHPMLLSKSCHLTRLIVEHYHRLLLHTGPRTTQSMIQRKIWILSAHTVIRKIIHRCTVCLRWDAKPIQPYMGSLPASRVGVSRCYAYTSIDFAGPIMTKETTRRKSPLHKSYVCIFVCEATKSCYIDATSDLSCQSFLACLDRMVSRCSTPFQIRTDNGGGFLAGRRQLAECRRFLEDNQETLQSEMATRQITWKLNPSYGSNFAGLVEACVRSTKKLLYRQIGKQILTFEEFTTLLARIQAILNSRPLAFLSTDPNDGVDYLTPAHFLVGGPLVAAPEMPMDLDITPLTRWKRVQQMAQYFWQRWHKEYLHTLMQREKWTKATPNLAVGSLVYITNQQTSPMSWPIGRVVATYPGKDSITRVVDVRAANRVYRRPVNKLVVIPID